MNVNTQKMEEYAEFLEENSRKIIVLCNKLEESLVMVVQCMDQQSGRSAAQRMAQNLENIKNNVPISDDASKRLILSKNMLIVLDEFSGGKNNGICSKRKRLQNIECGYAFQSKRNRRTGFGNR